MAMKWFRKHNKKILVGLAVLLMLAFVGGTWLKDLFGRGGRAKDVPVARALGEELMRSEFAMARLELALLNGMGIPVRAADPVDYALLKHEAREMGFDGGALTVTDDIANTITTANGVSSLKILAGKLQPISQEFGVQASEKLLLEAIGNYIAVIRAEQAIIGTPRTSRREDGQPVTDYRTTLGIAQPSEKQLEMAFRDLREQINSDYVAIPSWLYGSKVTPASESDIKAQFDSYKEEFPGTTENEWGFGYKQSSQVKIEYLSANLERIRAGLDRPSAKELAEYYELHKDLYVVPNETEADESEDSDAAAESEESDAEEPALELPKTYKPLEDVISNVRERFLAEGAQGKALAMIAKARSISDRHWEQLRKEREGAKIEPSKLYPYGGSEHKALVNLLVEEFGIGPEYHRTDWIDESKLLTLPGIGVSYSASQPMFALPAMVAGIRGPAPGSQEEDSRSQNLLRLGQDCGVTMLDAERNAYLFRVIEQRSDYVPTTSEMLADEKLRARVAADVVRRRAFDICKETAANLQETAKTKGLSAALGQAAYKDLESRQTDMVARADTRLVLSTVKLDLLDEKGKAAGEVVLGWQNLGTVSEIPQPVDVITVQVTNKSKKGRLTALAFNLPDSLRLFCPVLQATGSTEPAKSGGKPVSAGVEGYTMRYFGRNIEGGNLGHFDVLISFADQQLTGTGNLSKGGLATDETKLFLLQLAHAGVPISAAQFATTGGLNPSDSTGMGAAVVARMETAGKSSILRGIFPANRHGEFLKKCFAVLAEPGVERRPAPTTEDSQDAEGADGDQDQETPEPEVAADLLIDSFTGQAPCVMLELPNQGICYVMAVTKHTQPSMGEYIQSRGYLINMLTGEQYAAMNNQWWNSTSIRTRTGFELIEREQEE